MKIQLFPLLLFLFYSNIFVTILQANPIKQPKIAIIGSGIAGSSVVHYLQQTFKNINITLFEKENILGGRTHTYTIDNHIFEIGASFIISQNQHILDIIEELNLTTVAIQDLESKALGIFDTEKNQFLYKQSKTSKIISLLKMLWQFGPISLWQLKTTASKKLDDFLKIYEYQNELNPTPFYTLEEFLRFVNLEDSISKSGYEYLKEDIKLDQQIVDKLIRSVNMNFYSQNLEEVNGFTGTITLEGFASDGLIVKEGLNQISERLLNQLYKDKINLRKNTRVLSVFKDQNSNKFILNTKNKETDQQIVEDNFDIVIVAAPLEMAKIEFDKTLKISKKNFKKNDFESVYKYLVVGKLNVQIFNVQNNDEDLPEQILMTRRLFGSIALIYIKCRNCHQMKKINKKGDLIMIKASVPLEPSQIKQIFEKEFEIIKEFSVRQAYPAYNKTINNLKNLPDIILTEGIYYVNSLEFLASCIEVEVISAKNIVQLIQQNEGINWELFLKKKEYQNQTTNEQKQYQEINKKKQEM